MTLHTPALWSLGDLAAAAKGSLDGEADAPVRGVSIDTRSLAKDDLFVALKDARDGHEFVPAAFKAGAAAALVDQDYVWQEGDGALIRVDDPLKGLEGIARDARERTTAEAVIAVTGSVGKTGTKEMLRACLGRIGATHAPEKSFNNHWGVPLTLARMPAATRFGVFEIGMNHAGEITPLTYMVRPHAAIITSVEAVHIEHFPDGLEGIADAKAEIFLGLEAGGVAVIPADNAFAERLSAKALEASARVVTFGVICLLVFAFQDQSGWRWKADIASAWRAQFPHDLAWVDHDATKPLARLVGAANASVFDVSEFFNDRIGPTYVPEEPIGGRQIRSPTCTWHVAGDGTMTFDEGCGPRPARFYLDDYYAKFTFRTQVVEQRHPPVARIVSVPPPGVPRLMAEFFPPCGPVLPTFSSDGRGPTVGPRRHVCEAPSLGGRFWLERPGSLVLAWRGGSAPAQAAIGQQVYNFPAGVKTAIRVSIPASFASFGMQFGWRGRPPEVPELLSAVLHEGATATDLLY